MADPAPSEESAPPADQAAAGNAQTPPPEVGGETFANTKKHVAGKQGTDAAAERFANTKLNIALINDPKNGPRFTMTKRESGLADGDGDGTDAAKAERTDATVEATAPAKETKPPGTTDTDGADASAEDAPEAAKTAAGTAARTSETDAAADKPPVADKVQIDSTKTFVGHNGTYYDESWRWMDWRGTRRSWNWPAALSFGQWFAYRRLHRFAGLYLLWLAGLTAAAVNNVPILALVGLALLAVGLSGIYGNTLYFFAFRRAVDHVTRTGKGSFQERQGQLAAAGGTSTNALAVMGVLTIAGIAAALAVTFRLRGGFFLNFWPF